jgi:hypothetical protein
MHNLSLSNNINFGWIEFVKGVFDNCGYTYEWETHPFITDIWLKQVIKVRLQDQFRQLWLSTLNPYIEDRQTTQWPNEKVQKDKQQPTKYTHKTKDRVTRIPLKTGD